VLAAAAARPDVSLVNRGSRNANALAALRASLISLAASVGLAVAAATADGSTLAIFGVWAIVSGAVQLGTAAMRRRAGSRSR
jgi:hypothetical protein